MIHVHAPLDIFNTRATEEDPLQNNRFRVRIGGFVRWGFQKCSELDIEFEEINYRDGGSNATKRKRPGLAKFSDITLERGIINNSIGASGDVVSWTNQIFNIAKKGTPQAPVTRRPVDILVYDAMDQLFATYTLAQAWIKKATILGGLDAEASANLIEKVVLAIEGWELTFA